MKKATIVFCWKYDEILLGMKKRDFGVGKWNGFGGKVRDGETIKAAAMREVLEESGVRVKEEALYQVAQLDFWFENNFMFQAHVFFTHEWQGDEMRESDEMKPQWFKIGEIPFDEMWVDDKFWLPLVLSGKRMEGICVFNANGTRVKNFTWHEAKFD